MTQIQAVSDITYEDLASYLRLSELTADDINTLENLLIIAKSFISNYTGQTNLDSYQDFVIAVFVLCQYMWDNRTLYVDTSNLNYVVETILGMHSINLLPEVDT